MMRLFLAALLVCIPLSYCFEDTEFTKHLQSEIDEYLSEKDRPLMRPRRSPLDDNEIVNDEHFKCKQHSRKSCCGKTNLFKNFGDQNKTLGKTCYEEVSERLKQDLPLQEAPNLFSCEKYKMMKKLQYCVYECVGKKRKILTSDGDLNVNEMKIYLNNDLFKEDWQKELAQKAVPKCLSEKYLEWPQSEPGIICNPIAVQFQHCLWREFELNCPKNEQKDSKKCNKLRNNLKQQYATKRKV
ncbi:uncharacterized protein LOC135833234 [Planococcus citri]|uniref:uncharacterized protein LOC135833234 n=1 Tax=Planococcus citri TaxID=170843 RepID=UPI0031FA0D24